MTWSVQRFDVSAKLAELLKETALAPHVASVAELVTSLLFLHEEGRELRPAFLVTVSRDVTTAIAAERGEVHTVSLGPSPPTGTRTLVKQLAQLSAGCWVPCLELSPDLGGALLRVANEPYGTAIQAVQSAAAGRDAVMVEKVRDGHVRLFCGPNRNWLDLLADPRAEVHPQGAGPYQFLSGALAHHLHRRVTGGGPFFGSRMTNLLIQAIERCHGTIIAVARRGEVDDAFQMFHTCARIVPGLDLQAGEMTALAPTSITEAGSLRVAAVLHAVTGMDGIVVMSSDSLLLGYRCFIKPDGGKEQTGGARRLAWEALKISPQRDRFTGALFRSHDGALEFCEMGGAGADNG